MNDQTYYESISKFEYNFKVRIRRNVYDRLTDCVEYIPAHWHEHLEILYFKSGSCNVVCAGESFVAKAGDTVVVNPNELHCTQKSGEGEFFCIHVTPDFFYDVEFSDALLKTHIVNDKFISDCVEQMYLEYTGRAEGFDLRIKGITYLLAAHLLRNYKADTLSDSDMILRKNRLNRMGDILSYISRNYQTKLTTNSLAEQFHLTEHYFCSLFKKETGQSPINYINAYRIQKAAILLKNTDQSITQIAMSVGFEDSNYFARCFKKRFGVSAREYRRQA